jgi:hypothetical protein
MKFLRYASGVRLVPYKHYTEIEISYKGLNKYSERERRKKRGIKIKSKCYKLLTVAVILLTIFLSFLVK